MKTIQIGASQLKASAVALGIMRMVRLDTDAAANVLETVHDRCVYIID